MNADDKKGLYLVAFFLVLLVGFLVAIRGCDKKELNDDNKNLDIIEATPSPTPSATPDVEEETQKNDSTVISTTNTTKKKETYTTVQKQPEVKKIDLNQYLQQLNSLYQVAVGEDFLFPEMHLEEGVFVQVEYFFQELYGNDYQKVSSFSSTQPGLYRVFYTLRYGIESLQKEIYIQVEDTEAPIIEGLIKNEDPITGITSYEPVKSGSRINQEVMLSFRDNHEVSYVEYYKAKYEMIGNVNTIEQEGMQEIIEVDFTEDLILYEDGEYHVRAYDFSGNVKEYIITIDRTNPIVEITYSRIDKDHTLVRIDANEALRELEGWELSSDLCYLTKIYPNSQSEEITVIDLAGNEATISVMTTSIEVSIDILQAGVKTTSINLNTNDGDITISMRGTSGIELLYAYEDGTFQAYNNQVLTSSGYYTFQAVLDGIVMDSIEFYVSNQQVGD